MTYTCIAIRSFTDLANAGIDVYNTFYQPVGLDLTTFNTDSQNGVPIVALAGSDSNIVYIPGSYITGTPDQSGVIYQNVVLAVPLGLLPKGLDTSNLITSINGVVQSMIGVTANATAVITPLSETVTQAAAATIEAGRQGQITNASSDHAMYLQQVALNAQLQAQLTALTQLALANGLIATTT